LKNVDLALLLAIGFRGEIVSRALRALSVLNTAASCLTGMRYSKVPSSKVSVSSIIRDLVAFKIIVSSRSGDGSYSFIAIRAASSRWPVDYMMELSSNLISRIRIWERGERARRLFLNISLSHRRIKRERENDLFFLHFYCRCLF